jgi:hypothetical protein
LRKSTLIVAIVLAILAVAILVSRCNDSANADECRDQGGQWDYAKKVCLDKP